MKSQILQFKSILLLLFIVSLSGQPKLSVDLGTGFYEPTMKGFDSNENPWAIRNVALTLNQLSINYSISDCETDESPKKILSLFPEGQLTGNVKI